VAVIVNNVCVSEPTALTDDQVMSPDVVFKVKPEGTAPVVTA